jgi:sugar phosphate permease
VAQTSASLIHQGLPALGPLIQAEWSLTRAEFGIVVSALSFGVLLTSLASGQLVDRLGERQLLAVGPLGVAAGTLLASLSPSAALLTASLAVAGAFLATCAPSGGKAILLWFPPQTRGLAMGIRQTSIPLAGMAAAVAFPIVAEHMGWRGSLVFSAVLAAVGSVLIWLLYREPEAPPRLGGPAAIGFAVFPQLLRNRSLVATILLGTLLVAAQWSVVAYLGLFLYERFELPLVVAASYLALAQGGGVVGRLVWGLVSDRLCAGRRKPVLLILPPAGAAALAWLALAPSNTSGLVITAIAVALGATVIGWNGLFIAFLAEQAGAERAGSAIGLGVTAVFLSAGVSPPIFGWIVDVSGSYATAWLSVAASLVAALALFPVIRDVSTSQSTRA